MLACIVMNGPVGQAYGERLDQPSNAGALAQRELSEQGQSSSQQMGRDIQRTEDSDRESEAAFAGSHRSMLGESYGAIFGGDILAHGIDIEGTGVGSFVNVGTIGLKDSGIYGGKAGFFFPGRGNWAGVEVEAFRTTPDVKSTMTGTTVAGFPISLAERSTPGYDLSGEWEVLEIEENRTYRATLDRHGNGSYTWQGGQYTTTSFHDRRWQGTWQQTGNDREGGFELVLSEDGTQAKGIWWYTRVGSRKNIPPRQHGGNYLWKRMSPMDPAR